MQFDIIIPTDYTNPQDIKNLLQSISIQTHKPQYIIIVLDRFLDETEFQEIRYSITKSLDEDILSRLMFQTNLNSKFEPRQGISNTRNAGLDFAKSEFVFFIDGDNIFDKDFFEKLITEYEKISTQVGKEILLSPIINYRKTNIIQSYGFQKINSFIPKLISQKPEHQVYPIQMCGANSLFGPRDVFEKEPFDTSFKFVAEDIELIFRLYKKGIQTYMTQNVKTYHMERDKTFAETRFIQNPTIAYERMKNWIRLVKKNCNKFEKLAYFSTGLPFQTSWFILITLLRGKDKLKLIGGILKGVRDGIRH